MFPTPGRAQWLHQGVQCYLRPGWLLSDPLTLLELTCAWRCSEERYIVHMVEPYCNLYPDLLTCYCSMYQVGWASCTCSYGQNMCESRDLCTPLYSGWWTVHSDSTLDLFFILSTWYCKSSLVCFFMALDTRYVHYAGDMINRSCYP